MKNLRSFDSSPVQKRTIPARLPAFLLGAFAVFAGFNAQATVPIDSKPLTVANAVPGNLVLVPSFEWPTAITHANDPGKTSSYDSAVSYAGYFNPAVCYQYMYAAAEKDRYFKPIAAAKADRSCSDNTQWSGNFMNWVSAQAVDTFRMALTGGYRVKDVVGETWLEKATSDRYSSTYNPLRSKVGVSGLIPGSWSSANFRISGLYNQLWFSNSSMPTSNNGFTVVNGVQALGANYAVPYDPQKHLLPNSNTSCPNNYNWDPSKALCTRAGHSDVDPSVWGRNINYAVSVRVEVCDAAGVDRRTFCRRYADNNWKPEGLIQQNAKRLRFSAFGYQLSDKSNDGALMRARQKFVGPIISGEKLYPDLPVNTRLAMDNPEWDASTGIFIQNPDAVDAAATTAAIGNGNCVRPDGSSGDCSIAYSGVINYINRFGQIRTGAQIPLKGGYSSPHGGSGGADNVADLYYAALRYLRGEGPEAANTDGHYGNSLKSRTYADGSASGNDAVVARYQRADGLPAITQWYSSNSSTAQWTASGRTSDYDPFLYRCQSTVMLGIGDTSSNESRNSGDGLTGGNSTWLGRMYDEGTTKPSGNKNSLAAMAMWARMTDLRTDIPNMPLGSGTGKRGQNLSTYWVDVVETGKYLSKTSNQYYLATKYGGVKLPDDFYNANGNVDHSRLTDTWWRNNRTAWTSRTANVKSSDGDGNFIQPNNLYFANGGDAMIDGLTKAFSDILEDISGSGGSFASNTTRLETGAYTFQAKYSSNSWAGELVASSVNTSTGALTKDWDAKDWLTGSRDAGAYKKRQVYFSEDGVLTAAFTQNASDPAPATTLASKFASISSVRTLTDTQKNDALRYILGERSKERQFGGTYRNRTGMLGDIINSQPVFMGAPNPQLYKDDADYQAFAASNASRTPMLFVGANDGMLHAFNAGSGTDKGSEAFAFIPSGALEALSVSNPEAGNHPYWHVDYEHRYSVDGDMTIADVKTAAGYKTILVGTLGRGGRTIYALDVTTPESPSLLWEKTDAGLPELGNVLGKPIIAQVGESSWGVILGNGPNSSDDRSALLVLDIADGSVLKKIVPADQAANNGLGPVNVWDSDRDGIFDTVYAGDMSGKLYRFSLNGTGSVNLLYNAGADRPITAAPLVARNPYSPPDVWVYFGTGRYLSLADTTAVANAKVQAWYGMIDRGETVTQSQLQKIGVIHEDEKGRVIESMSGMAVGKQGWYMELKLDSGPARGERMVVSPFFQGLALIGTTRFPDSSDVCSPSGFGYTMAIDPFTGGRLGSVFFDADNNGVVGNDGDMHNGNPYSGLLYNSGPNNPIFIGDLMYTSMDDGSYRIVRTAATVGTVKRVSWREVLNVN